MASGKKLQSIRELLNLYRCAKEKCTKRVRVEGFLCAWHYHRPGKAEKVASMKATRMMYKHYRESSESKSTRKFVSKRLRNQGFIP